MSIFELSVDLPECSSPDELFSLVKQKQEQTKKKKMSKKEEYSYKKEDTKNIRRKRNVLHNLNRYCRLFQELFNMFPDDSKFQDFIYVSSNHNIEINNRLVINNRVSLFRDFCLNYIVSKIQNKQIYAVKFKQMIRYIFYSEYSQSYFDDWHINPLIKILDSFEVPADTSQEQESSDVSPKSDDNDSLTWNVKYKDVALQTTNPSQIQTKKADISPRDRRQFRDPLPSEIPQKNISNSPWDLQRHPEHEFLLFAPGWKPW